MKITVLYSGGLDSYILYEMAKKEYPEAEILGVYFQHGCESEEVEISSLPKFISIRKIDWLSETIKPLAKKSDPFASNIYIPGRNLVFSVLAACQDLPDEIWMGSMFDEDNEQGTDKNETFREMTSTLLSYVLSPFKDDVKLRFPFVEKKFSKKDSVRWALENGISKEELMSTTSCWHNKLGKACGKCKQCLKRVLVFELNGMYEEFEIYPMNDSEQLKRIEEYMKLYSTNSGNIDETTVAELFLEWYPKTYLS